MAKKETKNAAEIYREERKQRIAKANKKNAKGAEARIAAGNFLKKFVAVVLVIVIVGGLLYKVLDTVGVAQRVGTALTIGDTRISGTEYNYYYSSMYQQTAYYENMYQQYYGSGMGFNAELSPDDEANTTTDAEGNTITWAESFATSAKERAQYVVAYYTEGVKAGLTLTDEDKANIDETVKSYKDNATQNGFSLNAYLKSSFCPGFTEKTFRKLLEKDTLSSNYATKKQEELSAEVTDERINKEYKENGKDYDYVDAVYYSVAKETITPADGETEKDVTKRQETADKALKSKLNSVYTVVTDAATFEEAAKGYETGEKATAEAEEAKAAEAAEATEAEATEETAEAAETEVTTKVEAGTYASLSSSVSEDGAKWLFDAKRKAGDKKFIDGDGYFYIVLCTKPRYTSNSVTLREIFIEATADDDGNVSDEAKAEALSKANEILESWKTGEKTEETFATLATDNSTDDKAENGGLYENVRRADGYSKGFKAFAFASHKKGDVEVVEDEDGARVMYYVSNNKDDLDWKNTIRNKFGSEDFDAYEKDLLKEDGEYAVVESDFWTNFIINKFCRKIKKNLAMQAKQ